MYVIIIVTIIIIIITFIAVIIIIKCRLSSTQSTNHVLTKSINSGENRTSLRQGGSPWTTCVSWSNTLFHFGYGNRPVAVSI